jgi:hypothetical protein
VTPSQVFEPHWMGSALGAAPAPPPVPPPEVAGFPESEDLLEQLAAAAPAARAKTSASERTLRLRRFIDDNQSMKVSVGHARERMSRPSDVVLTRSER